MDCAVKGAVSAGFAGPAKRRCGVVAYCSLSQPLSHWSVHKEECERFNQQMIQARVLSDFPFSFCREATDEILEWREMRCSFLNRRIYMGRGYGRANAGVGSRAIHWNVQGPIDAFPESKYLSSWDDYCKWRDIPLHLSVALFLQWPFLIYWAVELVGLRNFSSGKPLYIHYLGPEKELLQVAAFGELRALFPDVQINIDIVGPAVPKHWDDETIELHTYAEYAEDECKCKCKIAADRPFFSFDS